LRNRKIVKSYICIFVCFPTKAIHIELASDLTSHSFLNCLKRFIARRGFCGHLYCDNGTNFVGAASELRDINLSLHNIVRDDIVTRYLVDNTIEWHFIPAKAPNFGGLWEAAVKSAKTHLKRIIGNTHLTYEETYTYLVQIEAVLNSRPLCNLSNDPNDFNALTPSHFLIGDCLTALPQNDLMDVPVNRLKKYEHIQKMVQHFWSVWSKEYLSQLQERSKWRKKTQNIQPGMMVVLREDGLPPLLWKLGRITEVHPGTDGIIRVVSVKTSSGILKRAASKICVLPIESY